ncbi:hypothetical protein C0J52_18362 [Blattella germanica]|nr:hypothetical protein C0J52_18362 [Blattella germanica]
MLEGSRKVGRPNIRWDDCIRPDTRICRINNNWRNVALNRGEWRNLLKTRVHKGLSNY